MPKKEKTPEEKKAWGEKMKAAREAKKQAEQLKEAPVPDANQGLNELLKQINELKDNPLVQAIFAGNQTSQNNGANNGVQIGSGKQGVFTKYITDPSNYPDPRERLFDFFDSAPKYRRFSLRDRYELRWDVSAMVPYERKDGILETQPRFVVGLDAIIFNEETYEPTNGRYVVKEFILFEDPQTAIVIAREQGLNLDESNEKAFLDEMRFIRIRDWLIEAFMPQQVQKTHRERKDMVVNGKQVQYFEISSENPEVIPFGELNTKLKA